MHTLQIIGHIGADAIETQNDTYYFDVAVNTWKELTIWYRVFTRQKSLVEYLNKGTHVAITGLPSYSAYEDKVQISIQSLRITLLSAPSVVPE